jgi:hypothetical protein
VEIQPNSSQLPDFNPSQNTLTLLSMLGGAGIVLAVLALAIGSAGGSDTNPQVVGIGVLSGLFLLGMSIAGWAIAVQPFKKFDNINEPIEDDHHGHAEHHEDDHVEAHSEKH